MLELEAVMKVKDIMTAQPVTCAPDTNLAAAAELMLQADCGILPVVEEGRLVGVVTDRDMYVALATRNRLASEISVSDVARKHVFTCGPDDEVHTALLAMKEHNVRRLPVAGFGGSVLGVISIDDILLSAGPKKAVRSEEVVDALQTICGHHHAALTISAS